jgi:hypothetical protein
LVDDYCSQPNPHAEPRAAQASLHPPAVVATKPERKKKRNYQNINKITITLLLID